MAKHAFPRPPPRFWFCVFAAAITAGAFEFAALSAVAVGLLVGLAFAQGERSGHRAAREEES